MKGLARLQVQNAVDFQSGVEEERERLRPLLLHGDLKAVFCLHEMLGRMDLDMEGMGMDIESEVR